MNAENVAAVHDHVQHVLVSTGIKGQDGHFAPERISALISALRAA